MIFFAFFVRWWSGVFAGVFEENERWTWCFCGQSVVKRLVGLGSGRAFFPACGLRRFFGFIC